MERAEQNLRHADVICQLLQLWFC